MKKISLLLLLINVSLSVSAQQEAQYTQFMLNDYGLNPAIAGSGKGIWFMAGRRKQWSGFEFSPETTFAGVTKAFGKKGYRMYWHGVGAYIEQDKLGIFTNKSGFVSYAIHLKLSAKYYLSFGIAAGMKSVALSSEVFDASDPAVTAKNQKVLVPNITPGLYFYSKKINIGLSVRDLYKSNLKQNNKVIGDTAGRGSILRPTFYFTLSRKYLSSGYDFLFVPSLNLQTNLTSTPSVNLNFMTYYRKRVGLGISYRAHDAVCAILQVRVFSNFVIGLSYDYTISKFRYARANSNEVMMGYSPVMSTEAYNQPPGAADCPKFELNF